MNGRFKEIMGPVLMLIFFVVLFRSAIAEYPILNAIIIVLLVCLPVMIYKEYQKNFKTKIASVDIPDYFEEMYQKLYKNNKIYSLEVLRKKARNIKIMPFLGFLIIIFNTMHQNLLLIFVGLIFIVIGFYNKYEKQYKLIYKKDVISEFIKLVSKNLKYEAYNTNPQIVQETYKYANFDNKSFNMFKADDYIEGKIEDDININMRDLHIQRKEEYYSQGKRKEQIIEIFQGIFTQTDCNKDIGTYIKISKNQLKIFSKNDRVEMDSQEFEKYFDIYSEDKILAMRILTSDVMSMLIDFYNRYNLEYEIVIRNNKIYMRFFTGPMFEPKIFGHSMDKQLLFTYFCILKFIVDITKEINKVLKEIEI